MNKPLDFCHLHVHGVNSRLDGMVTFPELMKHCKDNGMSAVSCTDHGNLSGAIEFYTEARKAGINPLIGLETYITDDQADPTAKRYHEGLIAMDWNGYKNLAKLSSDAFINGLQRNYFACTDDTKLEHFNEGIICLSGCISSRLAKIVMGGLDEQKQLMKKAEDLALYARDESAFQDARRRARSIAIGASTLTRMGALRAIEESKELHAFLDGVTEVVTKDEVEYRVSQYQVQARETWDLAWGLARMQVEKRLAVFGDRYYLETQINPAEVQQVYNAYVRRLAEEYNIPVVITADSHYLLRSDAEVHRTMLRIKTDKRKPESKDKKEVKLVEFPADQATAILASSGEEADLEKLYDDIIANEMACTGKKLNTATKAYAERRSKWVKSAELFRLQSNGVRAEDNAVERSVLEELSEDSDDAVDSGRTYADWSPEFWVRTPQEMLDAGAPLAEMEATVALSNRCNIEMELNSDTHKVVHMPEYRLPDGFASADSYLQKLCDDSLTTYIASGKSGLFDYVARLGYEMDVIRDAGFSNYFLVVWDYINHAREMGGLTGPGRGSAAASLVTFLLGITKLDPMQFPDLMFERFLTPGRADLPDIDTDFDYNSAEAVFEYCQEQYGSGAVAKIGTFSTVGVRQALQDVGRILNIPFEDAKDATRILGEFKPDDEDEVQDNKSQFSLVAVCGHLGDLNALRTKSAEHERWFELADLMQGKKRNASTHASGVAIASGDLVELGVPLMATNSGGRLTVATQFGMDDLAKLGIPKFDQLKLSNLNIIADAERLIGDDFSIEDVPLDDSATYAALSKGDNLGIFQVAQNKVRGVLRAVRPQSLGDIAAVITIIRPGLFAVDPETHLTQEELYKARRQGALPVRYKFEFLEDILKDTQGVMIYQEQVLKVCWAAGMTPLDADGLRKVLSKKLMSKAMAYKEKFIPGAITNLGLTEQEANELWDLIVEFAAYGFNAAHAYAYGLIGYWTSYLKTHYPAQFLASTISVLASKSSKAAQLLLPKMLEDCSALGRSVPLLAPDVNRSSAGFTVEPVETPKGIIDGIRFGLEGIKYVAGSAAHIMEARRVGGPFTSLSDFDERVSSTLGKKLSKSAFQSLAYSGALDEFLPHRSSILHEIEIRRSPSVKSAKELQARGPILDSMADLSTKQADLCFGHSFYKEDFTALTGAMGDFFTSAPGESITLGGRMVAAKLDQSSRSGSKYHSITLHTGSGDVQVLFFAGPRKSSTYLDDLKKKLHVSALLVVTGQKKDDRMMWGNTLRAVTEKA